MTRSPSVIGIEGRGQQERPHTPQDSVETARARAPLGQRPHRWLIIRQHEVSQTPGTPRYMFVQSMRGAGFQKRNVLLRLPFSGKSAFPFQTPRIETELRYAFLRQNFGQKISRRACQVYSGSTVIDRLH